MLHNLIIKIDHVNLKLLFFLMYLNVIYKNIKFVALYRIYNFYVDDHKERKGVKLMIIMMEMIIFVLSSEFFYCGTKRIADF